MKGYMEIYMKHPTLGNEHCDESEQSRRESQGWVRWPRTPEQKRGGKLGMAKLAESLGIKVDGRWSDARLLEEITAAEKKAK